MLCPLTLLTQEPSLLLLRKKCPYLELLWPTFFLHFPAFGMNTETYVRSQSYSAPHFFHIFLHSDRIRRDAVYLSVFSPNVGKCGENGDQNNYEYGHSGINLESLTVHTVYIWIHFNTLSTIHRLFPPESY